jgi:hypothetical protein
VIPRGAAPRPGRVARSGGCSTQAILAHRVPDTVDRSSVVTSSSGSRYNTAMASISIRNSGAASAETATSVCAGIFFPKNSSRIGP